MCQQSRSSDAVPVGGPGGVNFIRSCHVTALQPTALIAERPLKTWLAAALLSTLIAGPATAVERRGDRENWRCLPRLTASLTSRRRSFLRSDSCLAPSQGKKPPAWATDAGGLAIGTRITVRFPGCVAPLSCRARLCNKREGVAAPRELPACGGLTGVPQAPMSASDARRIIVARSIRCSGRSGYARPRWRKS